MRFSGVCAAFVLSLMLILPCVFCTVGKWDVFSSKTPYDWAHPQKPNDVISDLGINVTYGSETCNAIYVGMVVRHGARYPSASVTKQIEEIKETFLKSKDATKFLRLDEWVNPYNAENAYELVPIGQKELYDLGQRTGRRFSTLYKAAAQNVKFVSSSKQRAIDSSEFFYQGIKQLHQNFGNFDNQVDNKLLRFYDGCQNYEDDVDSPNYFREAEKFEESREFVAVIDAVKSRLGPNITLTSSELYVLYEMCAYDVYTQNVTNWCDLLTDQERLTVEYGRDIREFYERSYGNPINAELTCPLMANLFSDMDEVIHTLKRGDVSRIGGKLLFGHLGTVLRVMATFDMFNDQVPLRANNRGLMDERKFRTSKIAPYASNVAMVLYTCGEVQRTYAIKFLVNEQEVALNGCDGYMCKYDVIRERLSEHIDGCDLDKLCNPAGHGSGASVTRSMVALLIVGLVSRFILMLLW